MNIKLIKISVVISVVIGIIVNVGCIKVSYYPSSSFKNSLNKIQIFDTPPDKPYKVLGIIEVEGSEWTSKEYFVKALRKKALQVGGDGLIEVEYLNEKKGNFEKAKVGHYVSNYYGTFQRERLIDYLEIRSL